MPSSAPARSEGVSPPVATARPVEAEGPKVTCAMPNGDQFSDASLRSKSKLRVVDVSQLRETDHAAVATLRRACEETGFFLVTRHGVPHDLLDRIFAVSKKFFDLPDQEKLKHTSSEKTGWRGFNPYGSGQNCSLASPRPEVKETFYCGEPPSAAEGIEEPVEGFYQELREYHSALLELSRVLLRGLSLALELPAEHLENVAFQQPVAKVLLARYPPTEKGDLSCGSHTDCGFLTLVCQDSSEAQGLQVQRADGSWLSVKTDRYTFVGNLGDLAQRWTNDVF
ncbi:unnamed protein product [Durusdinium trenchii]|uniref:Uncharacterized protein n=1 Tax=Durusdinium trenchii TaxID=1381693 RepID=A0ABP0PMY9_9DINO